MGFGDLVGVDEVVGGDVVGVEHWYTHPLALSIHYAIMSRPLRRTKHTNIIEGKGTSSPPSKPSSQIPTMGAQSSAIA